MSNLNVFLIIERDRNNVSTHQVIRWEEMKENNASITKKSLTKKTRWLGTAKAFNKSRVIFVPE